MIKILTSSFNNYYEENNIKIAKQLDNTNNIIECIKDNLKENKMILFIPSDLNRKEKTNMYSKILFESLKLSGIVFDEYVVLEDINNVSEYINKASLVFLSGGDTYIENKLFNEMHLKEHLKNYSGLVIGQSAGTINMAKNCYNSPEEMEASEPIIFKGLGLVDINVEPHFIYDETNFDESKLYQREDIIYNSYEREIYGQCDCSHILIDDNNNIKIYGETYLIKNGIIKKICDNKEVLNINEKNR